MIPADYNLTLYRGDTGRWRFVLWADAGKTQPLDLTGASKLGEQVADSMLETFRKMPNLPAGFIDKLQQNMHGSDLIELIVPIYLKHYDRETMIQVIRFYQSEPGKALIGALPAVTAESMEAGKVWGKVLAEKTLHDLGYEPKKP